MTDLIDNTADLPTSRSDRRRHLRVRISVDAMLEAPPQAAVDCAVYNLSVGGALLGCRQRLRLRQPVVFHLDGFGPIGAHVARVTSTVVALGFEDVDQTALSDFIDRHAEEAVVAGRSEAGGN